MSDRVVVNYALARIGGDTRFVFELSPKSRRMLGGRPGRVSMDLDKSDVELSDLGEVRLDAVVSILTCKPGLQVDFNRVSD